MDSQVILRLSEAGIDAAQGISRVGGNEALYQKLLRKFLQEGTYSGLLTCIENKQWPEAAEKIHTLKGLAANLSIEELRGESIQAEQHLKAGNPPENMPTLIRSYEKATEAIRSLLGE
jgi:HPt (histidine-containing phosphotransfer) domain-containing protein